MSALIISAVAFSLAETASERAVIEWTDTAVALNKTASHGCETDISGTSKSNRLVEHIPAPFVHTCPTEQQHHTFRPPV
jgi:hypothetical protein